MKVNTERDEYLKDIRIKDFFDNVYLFKTNTHLFEATDRSISTKRVTDFYEWNSPGDYREITNEMEISNIQSLFGNSQIKTYNFHIGIIQNSDANKYIKVLFLQVEMSDLRLVITEIMGQFFRLNQTKFHYKAFNQKEFKNKFLMLYIEKNPIAKKLVANILNLYIDDERGRFLTIEDTESFNDIKLRRVQCLSLATFFANVSEFL